MSTPIRLASVQSGKEQADGKSAEALFISSLIEEGDFDPGKWRIDEEDLSCFHQLFSFCCDHQSRTGRAPAISLVRNKYPDFVLVPDIDIEWAANELRKEAASRLLRSKFKDAIAALNESDIEGAYAAMEGYMVPVSTRKAAFDSFAHVTEEQDTAVTRIPAPWEVLTRATDGGMGPGEAWAIGARLGQGKTTISCGSYVAKSVMEGFNVMYWSLEMPARQIIKKVNRALARRLGGDLLTRLDDDDLTVHNEALDEIKGSIDGRFSVYDVTHGPCDVRAVRDSLPEADLVVVDHIGLMRLGGKHAISDWRIAAEISNRLKEEVIRSDGRLLEICQINRQGDSPSPIRTPRAAELAGTDQIGQDADVIVTMNRFSTSVMLHSAEKVREGTEPRWFTRFDPAGSRFETITYDKAQQLAVTDEDNNERYST